MQNNNSTKSQAASDAPAIPYLTASTEARDRAAMEADLLQWDAAAHHHARARGLTLAAIMAVHFAKGA